MLKNVKQHLLNNAGSEYTEKIIIIAIVFIVGALFLGIVTTSLTDSYKEGIKQVIKNMFSN